jgi:hypothetical protein
MPSSRKHPTYYEKSETGKLIQRKRSRNRRGNMNVMNENAIEKVKQKIEAAKKEERRMSQRESAQTAILSRYYNPNEVDRRQNRRKRMVTVESILGNRYTENVGTHNNSGIPYFSINGYKLNSTGRNHRGILHNRRGYPVKGSRI